MAYKVDAITEVQTIQSIQGVVMSAYADIEANLGAHPSYTEAQTKLAEVRTLLEQPLKELKESLTFSHTRQQQQQAPEQQHALDEHAKFVADRAAGEVKT